MAPERQAMRIVVDGESFDVYRDDTAGRCFDWLTGPNEGYGSSIGEAVVFTKPGQQAPAAPEMDEATIRATIRRFLSQVDPGTGYIE